MGMYFELLNGRKTLGQAPSDGGTPGPVFGPLDFVRTTCSFHVKLGCKGAVHHLFADRDSLYYDGVWYADWNVFFAERLTGELQARLQSYDEAKARRRAPHYYHSQVNARLSASGSA